MTDYLDRPIDYNTPDFVAAFDELPFWSARFGALLLDHLDLKPGIVALDLGSGAGFPLLELAQRHGASSRFVGVDPWRRALNRAEFKRRTYGLAYVLLAEGDGARLPLPARSVDLVTANLIINNLADPPGVLAECVRVMKPGARFAMTSNLVGHMQEFYTVFREVVAGYGRADYHERLAANEGHRGTRESHSALLTGAGLRITCIIEDHFALRFVDGSALLRSRLVMEGFLPAWRAVVDPNDERAVFVEIEARLNALARAQGGLSMTVPMVYLEAERPVH